MNNRIGLLSVVLLLQALLVIGLLLAGGDDEAAEKLLEFDPAAVTSVTVADQDNSVQLRRVDGAWQVEDYPADAEKVDALVSDFANFTAPWPVSTTAASAERFEVTADNFQRHISLFEDETLLAEVYLGTSPGFQRVHAAVAGDEATYSIDFSNFKAPTELDEWLDKALLSATAPVTGISRDGWQLSKGEEGWLVDALAADQERAQSYVERFERLRILGLAETQEGGEAKEQIEVEDASGAYTLSFVFYSEADEYVVRSSRIEGDFRIATYIAEQILNDRDDLLPQAEAAEETISEVVNDVAGEVFGEVD